MSAARWRGGQAGEQVEHGVEHVDRRHAVRQHLGVAAAAGALGLAQGAPHRDPVQPGVQRLPVTQALGLLERGQRDVLRDVGRRLAVAEHAEAVRRPIVRARATSRSSAVIGGAKSIIVLLRSFDLRRMLRQRSTSFLNSRSSSPGGSVVSPVWTGPGWTIVLAGATSQWKRSDGGSWAIGPPAASPAAIRSTVASSGRTSLASQPGDERGEQRLVEVRAGAEEAQRAAEEHDAGVDRLAALDARDDPQRGVLERLLRAGTLGLLRPTARRLRAGAAGTRRTASPSAHSAGTSAAAAAGSARAASRASASAIDAGRGQQHVVADRRERAAGARPAGRRRGTRTAPRRGRSATGSPCQRSRFGLRGVRSTLVTSASSQTTSAASVGSGGRLGSYGSEPGRKSTPRLMPALARDQVLDLGVGLGVAERGVELDQHQLGHRQPERRGPARRPRSRPRAPSAPAPRRGT